MSPLEHQPHQPHNESSVTPRKEKTNRQVWKILALFFVAVAASASFVVVTQQLRNLHVSEEARLSQIPIIDESRFQANPIHGDGGYDLGVGHTFLINMMERKDRFEYMKTQFEEHNIPFRHFPAINLLKGNSTAFNLLYKSVLHPKTKFDLRSFKKSPNYTWGELGCWQSHLQILLRFADEYDSYNLGNEPILILEDDIKMAPDFKYYISHEFLEQKLPDDWEMLFLNHNGLKCHNPYLTAYRPNYRLDDYLLLNYYYPFLGWIQSYLPFTLSPTLQYFQYKEEPESVCLIRRVTFADAYIIRSPAVARKLVGISNSKIPEYADTYWNKELFPKKLIKAYALLHPVAKQQRLVFGSDIARWGAWNKGSKSLKGSHMTSAKKQPAKVESS